jgi:phosphoesterase RecJ-like protein
MHAKLFRNFTLKRFRLMTRMQQSLELHFDGRFAVQYLLKKDFEQTGTDYTDTEEFIDQCQRISSVESAALFVELPDGSFKCSLRSSGTVNVRQVAQRFGGGGHEMAAGVKLDGPLEQAKAKIFPLLGEQLNASGGNTEGPEEKASKNK